MDKLTLFGGKSQVDVYHFGPAHTNGDAIVTIPASNLAYLGELLPAKETPVIDTAHGGSAVAFPGTLARALEMFKANDIQFIVPGRAEPRRGGLQIDVMTLRDFEEYVGFNREFLDAARAAMLAGKTVEEAAATLKLPERYKNYGMLHTKANIQAIYDELTK
jgi:glyoxylase-like metal-dependent hydrolase (beta-lactamase superfamily II)